MSFASILGSIGNAPSELSKRPSISASSGPQRPTSKPIKAEPNKALEKLSIKDNAPKIDPRKDGQTARANNSNFKASQGSKVDPLKDKMQTKAINRNSNLDASQSMKSTKSEPNKPIERPSSDINPLKRKASTEAPNSRPSQDKIKQAPPPKPGSYAALMAAAKEKQKTASSTPSLGTIKHASLPKDRLTKRERRRREEEARLQAEQARSNKGKPTNMPNGGLDKSRLPGKVNNTLGYKGTAQPPPPKKDKEKPKAPIPTYRGTAGLGGKKPPPKHRPPKQDRYLDTDEEEDDFIDEDESDDGQQGRRYTYASGSDEGDGYSDSDDMEAGAFDVEQEERSALRAAQEDDKREEALEKHLKKEKEERRRKLESLSKNAKARRY
ncbi:MAG: hypothetical protein Q9227_003676 [Pyrenula ochraceoflavens]